MCLGGSRLRNESESRHRSSFSSHPAPPRGYFETLAESPRPQFTPEDWKELYRTPRPVHGFVARRTKKQGARKMQLRTENAPNLLAPNSNS